MVMMGEKSKMQRELCYFLTRDAGPKPHIVPRDFLGFAEKSPRRPYIVGQAILHILYSNF